MSLHRKLAVSDHWIARIARGCDRGVTRFSVPAPRVIFFPILKMVLALRHLWYFVYRVFFCEPLFKAYCKKYGKNVHTDVYLHWIQGKGELLLGNNILIDGKCSFRFAARFSDVPTLSIGDNTSIGHHCSFVVGKRIAIGKNCRIASDVSFFDSPGHPLDPQKREAGSAPDPESVREITIGDNVWLGTGAVIFPGVTVGDNSIISVRAVVMTDVPPNVVVSGNPARKILYLQPRRAGPDKIGPPNAREAD
jgi:acetyltransferase-like isoleucine patch superfamily enzyme